MPRYDYKCTKHGHIFEIVQGFHDDPVAFCPEDGSSSERQLSIPHVIYKGSGFYTTDYKNSSSSPAGSNGSSSSSSSESSASSTKSESKSETKSESKSASKSGSSD